MSASRQPHTLPSSGRIFIKLKETIKWDLIFFDNINDCNTECHSSKYHSTKMSEPTVTVINVLTVNNNNYHSCNSYSNLEFWLNFMPIWGQSHKNYFGSNLLTPFKAGLFINIHNIFFETIKT